MKLKKKIRTLLTVGFLSCALSVVQAQGPGDPGGDPDPNIPLDGGLSLLIAAGIGFAAKKAYDTRKKDGKTDETEGTDL